MGDGAEACLTSVEPRVRAGPGSLRQLALGAWHWWLGPVGRWECGSAMFVGLPRDALARERVGAGVCLGEDEETRDKALDADFP